MVSTGAAPSICHVRILQVRQIDRAQLSLHDCFVSIETVKLIHYSKRSILFLVPVRAKEIDFPV